MALFHFGAPKIPVTVSTVSTFLQASAVIYAGRCVFKGIIIKTNGTNNATFTVYNGQSDAGVPLTPTNLIVPAADRFRVIEYEQPVGAPAGIYVKFDGGGGSSGYMVLFDS